MSTEFGIEEELTLQLSEVRKELKKARSIITKANLGEPIVGELEILAEQPFLWPTLQSVGKPIKITGVALTEGTFKNIIYTPEEIQRAAKALIGKPLLVEHGRNPMFKDA